MTSRSSKGRTAAGKTAKYVTVAAAAIAFAVEPTTIRSWIAAGKLRAVRTGRRSPGTVRDTRPFQIPIEALPSIDTPAASKSARTSVKTTPQRVLRIVTDADIPAAPLTVFEAASTGGRRETLIALRDRIARAVTDPACPTRELASLSKRLTDILGELEAMTSADGGGDLGNAVSTPDEAFDAEAL